MALDVFDSFMGLKDHLDDGTGHILDLRLDLDYLHVKATATVRPPSGADVHANMEPGPSEEAEGRLPVRTSLDSSSGIGSTSADSEESTDSEAEQISVRPGFPDLPPRSAHPQLCRSPCLDLESTSPPDDSVPENQDPAEALRTYRNKMEFALKLGYQEDLIRLVLSKLGPEALINDILGELVKLGSKSDGEQGGGQGSSQSRSSSMAPSSSSCSSAGSTTSSSGCGFSDSTESRQSDSPSQMDTLDDKDNLRPVVIDGSNVAMR